MKMLALLSTVLALVFMPASSQVEVAKGMKDDAPFDVDVLTFASNLPAETSATTTDARSQHLSRLHIFAAIPYEQLSFTKEGDKFVASYEFTIDIYDSSNALVAEKLYTTDVKVPTFEQSVSSASYSIERMYFHVPPGVYRIAAFYRDRESRVMRRVMKQLTVSDYTLPGLQLSDIMLVSKLTMKEGKTVFTPSISPNVGEIAEPMHIFFEAYNDAQPDSILLEATVLNDKNREALRADTTIHLNRGRNQIFLRIDQTVLPIGDYKLFVQAFRPGTSTTQNALATTSRAFIVRWNLLPKSLKDLDLAIEQLVYIAKDKELDYIKQASSADEKQKRFLEFWKKKDPNPNTVRNERMEEYYGRVEYANKYFKHYTEGWRTDMGMIYIIFGPPSNVDRHPFDANAKPYEIWSYFDLNYSFVFVDQTGFGDYRLTTPIWDVWKRARE